MIWLGEIAAEELLLPYRGVLSYHGEAVRHLKSGPSVALRIEVGGMRRTISTFDLRYCCTYRAVGCNYGRPY